MSVILSSEINAEELQTPRRAPSLPKGHQQRSEKLVKRPHASELRFHELKEQLAVSCRENYPHLEAVTARTADIALFIDCAQSMERCLESQRLTLLEFQKPSQTEEIPPPSAFLISDVETDLNVQIKLIASNSVLQPVSMMHIVFSLIICQQRMSILSINLNFSL